MTSLALHAPLTEEEAASLTKGGQIENQDPKDQDQDQVSNTECKKGEEDTGSDTSSDGDEMIEFQMHSDDKTGQVSTEHVSSFMNDMISSFNAASTKLAEKIDGKLSVEEFRLEMEKLQTTLKQSTHGKGSFEYKKMERHYKKLQEGLEKAVSALEAQLKEKTEKCLQLEMKRQSQNSSQHNNSKKNLLLSNKTRELAHVESVLEKCQRQLALTKAALAELDTNFQVAVAQNHDLQQHIVQQSLQLKQFHVTSSKKAACTTNNNLKYNVQVAQAMQASQDHSQTNGNVRASAAAGASSSSSSSSSSNSSSNNAYRTGTGSRTGAHPGGRGGRRGGRNGRGARRGVKSSGYGQRKVVE